MIACELEGYLQNEFKSTVIAKATSLRTRNAAGAPGRSVVILMVRDLGIEMLKEMSTHSSWKRKVFVNAIRVDIKNEGRRRRSKK